MGLSHSTVSKRSSLKGWTDKQFKELLKTPGTHKHPSVVGFYLRVSPKGKNVWAYKFRGRDSAEKSGTLGLLREVSLDDALTAYDLVREREVGPEEPEAPEQEALTLATGFKRWTDEHRKTRGRGKSLSPETVRNYTGIYSLYLEPVGHLQLANMTTGDWRQILEVIEQRSPHQARRAFAMLSSMYAHFIDNEELEKNPIRKRTLRDRFVSAELTDKERLGHLTMDKFADFWAALQKRPPNYRRPVENLMLTGWRLSGVLALEFSKVDLKTGILTLDGTEKGWKAFRGEIAINEIVLESLRERREVVKGRYVYPIRHISHAKRTDRPYNEAEAKAKEAKRKEEGDHRKEVRGTLTAICKEIGVARIGAHDLRRTFSRVANVILDGNVLLVGRLLGHTNPLPQNKVTVKYMVRDMQEERESALLVANAILGLCGVMPLSEDARAQLEKRGVRLAYDDLAVVSDEDEALEEALG